MEHALQKKELSETKRVLDELKKEYELKSRECQEASKSLNEIQNELMRKSMHVGSLGEEVTLLIVMPTYYRLLLLHSTDILLHFWLIISFVAFAIEGQVKEKSKWFTSLRDLTRKLKVRRKL